MHKDIEWVISGGQHFCALPDNRQSYTLATITQPVRSMAIDRDERIMRANEGKERVPRAIKALEQ